jgi:hypothetical protein
MGTTSSTSTPPAELAGRPRPLRRWPKRAVVVLLGLALLALATILPALAARARLVAGREELLGARDRLVEGDVGSALTAFGRAETAFDDARGWARSPLLWAIGGVPFLGRSADGLVVLAESGREAAAAGRAVMAAVAELPGGIEALAPREGRLPISAIASLAPATATARADLERALRQVQGLPTSFLIGPVAEARDQALHELSRALQAARTAEALTAALPELAGAGGERRYFVAVQSPAELRGTGGYMGAYGILTASGGRLTMGPVGSVHPLNDLPPGPAPTPPESYGAPFDRFGGPGFWGNLNMDPHAPTAARLIEALYEHVTGERVDGVIFVDPQALAEMLEATGPVRPPSFDRTLESGTIVDYLLNEAYLEFGDSTLRKRVLGAAATAVWTRFMEGAEPLQALRALAAAAAGGHLVLHSTDPAVQSALETAGIAGTLDNPTGNLFGVFASNSDGTKVDYYLDRSIGLDVALEEEGVATVEATISTANGAPTDAVPGYVFGPNATTGLGPGDSKTFLSAYCAPGCELTGSGLAGEPVGLEVHADRAVPVFSTYVRTDAGASSSLRLSFEQTHAWEGDELGGSYVLTIRGQPMVRPTAATIVVQAPPGMRIVDTSVPMQVEGSQASWQGTLGPEQRFVVRFQQPLPARLWTQLWAVLTRPVLG